MPFFHVLVQSILSKCIHLVCLYRTQLEWRNASYSRFYDGNHALTRNSAGIFNVVRVVSLRKQKLKVGSVISVIMYAGARCVIDVAVIGRECVFSDNMLSMRNKRMKNFPSKN